MTREGRKGLEERRSLKVPSALISADAGREPALTVGADDMMFQGFGSERARARLLRGLKAPADRKL